MAVTRGEVDIGIVICHTGTGVCIVANKVQGVRATLCVNAETAKGVCSSNYKMDCERNFRRVVLCKGTQSLGDR